MFAAAILGWTSIALWVLSLPALFYLLARYVLYPRKRPQLSRWSGVFTLSWFAGTAGSAIYNGAARDQNWTFALLGASLSIVFSSAAIYIAWRVWRSVMAPRTNLDSKPDIDQRRAP